MTGPDHLSGEGEAEDVTASTGEPCDEEQRAAKLGLSTERAVAPLRALLDPLPADDVLVLTYTANLGFFSRSVAGRTRARGARVSIISDPSQTSFDPNLVRGAGVDWLDGRAWCKGAFHPKLIVAASDNHATVCIGSGNATPSGWVTNAELWVRFDASPQQVPGPVAQVAAWLTGLGGAIDAGALHVGPGVHEAIASAAKRLSAFAPAGSGDDSALVVSNLGSSILESLPRGPVDELIVTSPFLDDACEALGQVCERLRPAKVAVNVTDDFRYHGPRLAELVRAWNGTVSTIEGARSYHGKLLEWSINGHRKALVGSPNVTRAAMLRTLGDEDANCELGAICDLTTSLAPPTGAALTNTALEAHAYRPPSPVHAPMLVGAVFGVEGTTLTLAKAASRELLIEAYDGTVWTPTGHRFSAGETSLLIQGWHPAAGTPLRVRPPTQGMPSAPCPVTDLRRLAPRQPSRAHLPGSSNAFPDDPRFVEQLRDALARLRVSWHKDLDSQPYHAHAAASHGLDAAAPSDSRESRGIPAVDEEVSPTWATTPLGRLHREAGSAFSEFVLPELTRSSGEWRPPALVPMPGTDSGDDDPEADPDEDEAARRRREHRIADLRRWCERQVDPEQQSAELKSWHAKNAHHCTLADVCMASVVLAATVLDAWSDPEEARNVVLRVLRRLASPPESPDLAGPAASAAAVGIWVLARLTEDFPDPFAARVRVHKMAELLNRCLDSLDDAGLGERCRSLATLEHPLPPNPTDVWCTVLDTLSPDPVEDLVAHYGAARLKRDGHVLTFTEALPRDGVVFILGAWSLIEAAAPVAIQAETEDAGRVLVAWRAPHLVVSLQGPVRHGFLYEFKQGLSAVAGADNHRPPAYAESGKWYWDQEAPILAHEVVAATGASLSWTS